MTPVLGVLERRLLGALAQAASSGGAGPWKDLRPREPRNLRSAAAVFDRVAELSDRKVMTAKLGEIATTIKNKRGDRGEREENLFEKAATKIESLGELAPEKQGLLGLELWNETGVPLGEIYRDLGAVLPESLPVRDDFLLAAARVLLRGRARSWLAEARRRERAETKA